MSTSAPRNNDAGTVNWLLCSLCCLGDHKSRCTCGRKHRWQFLSLCPHTFGVPHSPTMIPARLWILKGSQWHLIGKVLYSEHIVLWATNHPSTHVITMTLESLAQMPPQYIQLIKKEYGSVQRLYKLHWTKELSKAPNFELLHGAWSI